MSIRISILFYRAGKNSILSRSVLVRQFDEIFTERERILFFPARSKSFFPARWKLREIEVISRKIYIF